MKHISLRLFLALLTFIIGIAFAAFWSFESEIPDVPILKSEQLRSSNFIAESQLSKDQKNFWEKQLLPRFRELPLKTLSNSVDETYRFVLLPAYDAPITICIWRLGDQHFLITKKTNDQGGFGMDEFGKLSYENTRLLSQDEWNSFIKLLDEASFWDMPELDGYDIPPPYETLWVIEGYSNKTYHEVHRFTLNKEFKDSCAYLLKLSGLENEYEGY